MRMGMPCRYLWHLTTKLSRARRRRLEERVAILGVGLNALLGGQCLEQLPELLDRESGVTHKTAHGECVDRVVTRNG